MNNLYWLNDVQIKRLKPLFPRAMASPVSMTVVSSAA